MKSARAPANDVAPAIDPDAAYRASVSIHYPNSDELTMAVRVRLMASRDRAALALNRCCPDAIPALVEANRVASLAALSSMSIKRLSYALIAADSLIFAAQMMQRASA